MRKWLSVLAAAMTLSLVFAGVVQGASGATVTKVTVPSFFANDQGIFFATCDVTQVVNANHRKETFQCSFDDEIPAPVVCDTAVGCFWASDIDGAPAISTHFVITPSGNMLGWATYY